VNAAIPAEFRPVRVGDGHGFVVEGQYDRRFVLTAAHCLPHLPPPAGLLDLEETTYRALLGPFKASDAACTVWAECLFADPFADIAVLGEPDTAMPRSSPPPSNGRSCDPQRTLSLCGRNGSSCP
jgi:hypothetical protein